MKFYLILFTFCIGLGQSGLSQSKKPHRTIIKGIRKECENYNSDIKRFQNSEKEGCESIRVNEVSIDKYKSDNHPGLGQLNSTINFYYYVEGVITEGVETLFKIERVDNMAAHREYNEYYFNADGQLIFYFELIDGENASRFYFNDEKLIEYRQSSSMHDERYKGDSLSKSHLRKALEALEKTGRLKTVMAHFY